MAGGIDWFRWHHGSVTDPKFQLVAKKSKASISEVIAVWAFLLESASAAHDRGNFGEIDCDAVDCLYGMEDGKTSAILTHMQERGLIADNCVCNWSKRQPKREDDTSAERKRRQRERDHELELANSVTSSESRNVTQCHAGVTHGHDRGEESREEVLPPVSPLAGGKPAQRKSRVPVDFQPNDTATEKAKQLGVDVGAEVPKFIDYHTAKGSLMVDWQAAFRTWLGNARPTKQAGSVGEGLKYGSDEYFEFHRRQSWWADAGFDSVWEAVSSRCNHKNFAEFRNGQRLEAA